MGAPRSEPEAVSIEMPVIEHGKVISEHLTGKLTPRQGRGLRLLFDGLVATGETVRYAKDPGARRDPVKDQPDAVRWLLDRIADAAGVP